MKQNKKSHGKITYKNDFDGGKVEKQLNSDNSFSENGLNNLDLMDKAIKSKDH
ncbi:hypothetical protein [Bacillus sp. SA1-12]|uniref:hypothetical protein n=1 Tax=Bacillus sp. SA1-12 TaxID=1455638 RepID=UPI000AD06DF9|nr:hypothetical protein [Bacillus sp. SA1-12]